MAKNPPRKSASQTRTAAPRTDLTARRRDDQAKALTEEQIKEQERITTVTAAKKAEDSTTIDDFTGEGVSQEELDAYGATAVVEQQVTEPAYEPPLDEIDDKTIEPEEVQYEQVSVASATEIVRPREDCRFIFGAGNYYSFSAGRAAKVPAPVAAHMREKGLVWD